MSLNTFQSRAVRHKDGPVLVLAGPGSGKTTVIIQRVHHLIEYHKVLPEKIIVLTFTRAAAREMKERFFRICNSQYANVSFLTIHALCYDIICGELGKKKLEILTEKEAELLRKKVKRELFYTEQERELTKEEEMVLYRCFQQEKKKLGYFELEDLVNTAYRLLYSKPVLLRAWQNRFSYYLIDEFQDTSMRQLELLFLLCDKNRNIMVVGDDDQSIYAFRGATPEVFRCFKKKFPETDTIQLKINYRCRDEIIRLSEGVIEKNTSRICKEQGVCGRNLINVAGFSAVTVRKYKDQWEQMEEIIKEIKRLKEEEGISYQEIGVLFRTQKQFRLFQICAKMYGLPLQIQDIPGHSDLAVLEDICCYLDILEGKVTRKKLFQIMNRPERGIHRIFLDSEIVDMKRWHETAAAFDKEQGKKIYDFLEELRRMKSLSPYPGICQLYYSTGYKDYACLYGREYGIPQEAILWIMATVLSLSKTCKSYGELKKKIEGKEVESNKEGVMVSTMHASKGLEFDAVFLPDLNEDIIPNKKAVLASNLEEERRVFYVALTRAKNRLYLTYVEKKNNHSVMPSQFLTDLIL